MSRVRKSGLVVVACLGIAGVLQAAPSIERPVVLPEAMLSITVSDLHGLIDGVGSVAAQVSPMMNGLMLKNMIGMEVGDPGLVGMELGKGFAVVALDTTNVFAVIELAEVQAASFYTNFIVPQQFEAKYTDGLMVVGKTKEQVAKGAELAKAVESSLLENRSPTLRIALQPAAVIEKNEEQIQGMLAMMPMMGQGMMQNPGTTLQSVESTTKLLEGEVRVLLSLAEQCESAEVVLAPQNGSIRITETFVPKAGSRLAMLCNAPVANQPNPKVNSGYLGGGAIRLDSTTANPSAMLDFMVAEAEQLAEQLEITEIDLPELAAKSAKLWMASGGSFSETMSFGGESGVSVGCLMDVTDEAEALAVLKSIPQDMAPLLELYEEMDMSMIFSFKENVREYKGSKIHQLAIDMAMTNQPAEVTAQLASMNMTNMVYDIAITDGVMIYAMGDEKIETIIDRLADESFEPAPLESHGVYPADGFYYFDLDMGEYMAFATSFMPVPVMEQMGALFQEVEPITSAGFKADGNVMWSINIPGELIAKYGQMAMMMQMQQMQQQGGGMPPLN